MIFLFCFIIYMLPGFVVARSLYAKEIKELGGSPVRIPPKPQRPRLKMVETTHIKNTRNSSLSCRIHRREAMGKMTTEEWMLNGVITCDCANKEDFHKIKNEWLDYNEWIAKYDHLDTGVKQPSLLMCYSAVPVWPIVLGGKYIKGGADNIPEDEAARQERLDKLQFEIDWLEKKNKTGPYIELE